MRVAVLSRCETYYCTRRLLEQGAASGHAMQWLPILLGWSRIGAGAPIYGLTHEPLARLPEAVIARVGSFHAEFALTQLQVLEALGVRPLNTSAGIERARDKFRSLLRLSAQGLPVPHSVLVKDLDRIDTVLADLDQASGASDVVIKPVHGAQGRGVMLALGRTSAASVLEGLICAGQEVLVQEFLTAAVAGDQRLLVLDGAVVGAVRRRPPAGGFRSNVHRGAIAEPLATTPAARALAVAAAGVLGLRFAGVDLVERRPGDLVVLEVNPSPGWEGLEKATGVDVAALVMHALAGDPA
ncbi:MAG: RimK family alpha-L-glutamate ligase [Planctomycetota bacterium]